MPERLKLATICAITDDDTGMYRIGEIDGGFDDTKLEDHIKDYGSEGLLKCLAYMHWQVMEQIRKPKSETQPVIPHVLDTDQPARITFTLGDGVQTYFHLVHRIGHLNYVVELYDRRTKELILFPSEFIKGPDLVAFTIVPAPAPDSILICINY
jgi:hypothetical protein